MKVIYLLLEPVFSALVVEVFSTLCSNQLHHKKGGTKSLSSFCKFIIQNNQLLEFGGIKRKPYSCIGTQAKRDNLDVYP